MKNITEFLKGFGFSTATYTILYLGIKFLPESLAFLLLIIIPIIAFGYSIGAISYSVASFKVQPLRSLGISLPAVGVLIWIVLVRFVA
jgi:hypothetical protein